MAKHTPHSASRTPQSKRLVPLLLDWFAAHARDLPWRRTRNPYAIWVSEIMLQQTQVKTVIPYWERWMRELPTIEAVARAKPAKIHKLWEGLGYYTRVRNLQKAARQIAKSGRRKAESGKFVCRFPNSYDEVLDLPGVGRYTAGAICSIAFNQPAPILDGNVIRVLTRIFGIAKNPKEKETNRRLWKISQELVGRALRCPPRRGAETAPYQSCSHLNQSLMELGARICTPRNPQCRSCPVKELCVAFHSNRVNRLPNFTKREKSTAQRWVAFVMERDGKFLVHQRPAGVVNAHLWEFPNVEVTSNHRGSRRESSRSSPPRNRSRLTPAATSRMPGPAAARAAKTLGLKLALIKPLAIVKHSITRYRITLEAFAASAKRLPSKTTGVWRTPAQMRRLAFAAAHKKLATLAVNRILSGP